MGESHLGCCETWFIKHGLIILKTTGMSEYAAEDNKRQGVTSLALTLVARRNEDSLFVGERYSEKCPHDPTMADAQRVRVGQMFAKDQHMTSS